MQITNEKILSEFNRCVDEYRQAHPTMPHKAIVSYSTAIIAEAARKHVETLLNTYNEHVVSSISG